MDDAQKGLPALEVPPRFRGFVYVVGMVGFPVVVAAFVLVTLSADIKEVNKSLTNLATRIDERPLGLERSSDLVIYISDSLRSDLQAGLPALVNDLDFEADLGDPVAVGRCVSIIDRQVAGYIRPIVRKHQRFAARFPTVGGNLSSFFSLFAPAEDVAAGMTEAGLVGRTYKDVGEALNAIIMNNIVQFGVLPHSLEGFLGDMAASDPRSEVAAEDELLSFLASLGEPSAAPEAEAPSGQRGEVIDSELFLSLALDAVETVTTVLQDQMLEQLRVNSSELGDE